MSVKNEQTENLKEEVAVNEVETTELVEVKGESKKAKTKRVAKKVGKIAAVAGIGILGYILGTKAGKKSVNNNSEIIDVEYDTESDD